MKTVRNGLVGCVCLLVAMLAGESIAQDRDWSDIAPEVQKTGVTIKIPDTPFQGSGILVTRDLVGPDGKIKRVNFVVTAGHVIEDAMVHVPTPSEAPKQYKWKRVDIIKIVFVNGERKVIKRKASVIAYSKHDDEDMAILMIEGDEIIDSDAKFCTTGECYDVGSPVVSVSSPRGQHQSVTCGIMSFLNRAVWVNNSKTIPFDQFDAPCLPGSSGGGIFNKLGVCIGIISRQSADDFTCMVPMRRIMKWAKDEKIDWVFDPCIPAPSYEDAQKLKLED